jgi:hypothetical protein
MTIMPRNIPSMAVLPIMKIMEVISNIWITARAITIRIALHPRIIFHLTHPGSGLTVLMGIGSRER